MMAYVITFLWGVVIGYNMAYLLVRKLAKKIQCEVDAYRKERKDIMELLGKFIEEIEGASKNDK